MKGLTEGGREHPIMFRVLSHIRIDIRNNTFNGIAVLFYEKALFRLSFCGKSSNVNGIDSLVRFLVLYIYGGRLSFCIVNIPAPSWYASDEMNHLTSQNILQLLLSGRITQIDFFQKSPLALLKIFSILVLLPLRKNEFGGLHANCNANKNQKQRKALFIGLYALAFSCLRIYFFSHVTTIHFGE